MKYMTLRSKNRCILYSRQERHEPEMGTVRFVNLTEPIGSVRKFAKRFRFRFGSVRFGS
jgi:hypothetical protein